LHLLKKSIIFANKNYQPMRYLLTGLGLFLLMTFFVWAWFIKTNTAPKVVINESPIALVDEIHKVPEAIYTGTIILKDNLLLKSIDYQEIEKAVNALGQHPKARLDIYPPSHVDTAKINSTLRTILTDQGVLATRFQFLRKPSKLTKEFQILLQVK